MFCKLRPRHFLMFSILMAFSLRAASKKAIFYKLLLASVIFGLIILISFPEHLISASHTFQRLIKLPSAKHVRVKCATELQRTCIEDNSIDISTCLTQKELQERLDACRNRSLARNVKCKAVHSNPDRFWRPKSINNPRSDKDDLKRMNLASKCCAFNYVSLMEANPRDKPYPWERNLLCSRKSPLYKMEDTAYASLSSVRFLYHTPRGGTKKVMGPGTKFFVGDSVTVEVVVRNGIRELRSLGGDSVRVWLVNSQLGASVVADVTDLKNGSYVATSVLPWSGAVKVKATIAHTREYLRLISLLHRSFITLHWIGAVWKKGEYSEATICAPYPALPAHSKNEICNVTSINGGSPWYCGEPSKPQLNCSDYFANEKLNAMSELPWTTTENKLMKQVDWQRPFLVPSNVSITVNANPDLGGEKTLPNPSLPCNQRSLSETFKETDQSGYLYNKMWRPFPCRLPEVNANFVRECLRNTRFISVGDSNARQQYYSIKWLIGCKDIVAATKAKWHRLLQCDEDKLNISLSWIPHQLPMYGSMGERVTKNATGSEVEIMDVIPPSGKHIVHLHHFLHFSPYDIGVLEIRLRLVRSAIQRLLARNPEVLVLYQSAHTAYTRANEAKFKLVVFILEMQRSILSGLGERVMFVRTFPITVAAENALTHPACGDQFLALYMGHICGRKL